MKKMFLVFCLFLVFSALEGAHLALTGTGTGAGAAWAAGKKGTAAEARAMLNRAVTAMKADKNRALEYFTAGLKGFKDRDLFVFCARKSDRVMVAHGGWSEMVGVKMRRLTTKKGRRIGDEILDKAKPGKFIIVKYFGRVWGSKKRKPKETFVTEVVGHACGVGYFP